MGDTKRWGDKILGGGEGSKILTGGQMMSLQLPNLIKLNLQERPLSYTRGNCDATHVSLDA